MKNRTKLRIVNVIKRVYRFVPFSFRIAGFGEAPLSLRLARIYKAQRRIIREMYHWDREAMEAYQLNQLRSLLQHCAQNVPFYREFFQQEKIQIEDFQTIRDIRRLPIVDKRTLSEQRDRFCAENYPKRRFIYVTTGGSTGIPFGFYLERGITKTLHAAFLHESWVPYGWTSQSSTIVLRGKFVGCPEENYYWEQDALRRYLFLSTYHLTPSTIEKHYLPCIAAFLPDFIDGYPSAVTILARYLLESNSCLPPIKGVLLSSENLYPWQYEVIRDAFKCPVVPLYGMTEHAGFAFPSGNGLGYYFHPAYGIFELLDKSGEEVTTDGERGEIVLTSFLNSAMPFIRYRTDDIAMLDAKESSDGCCFKKVCCIEGRLQELLLTRDGRLISMAAINMHNALFDRVEQYQFVQHVPGAVVMKIVRKAGYTLEDEKRILREIGSKLSGVDMKIEYVQEIPRTATGKFRFLIQHLPIQYSD